MSLLDEVTRQVLGLNEQRIRLDAEAKDWVRQQMAKYEDALEDAVVAAVAEHSVIDVARAYTISGAETPNRNAIYGILRKRNAAPTHNDFPFKWKKRTITTAQGKRVVWDAYANLSEYGPEAWSGEYRWRYDNGDLDPIIGDIEPYPTTKYYRDALGKWLSMNPYPGGE